MRCMMTRFRGWAPPTPSHVTPHVTGEFSFLYSEARLYNIDGVLLYPGKKINIHSVYKIKIIKNNKSKKERKNLGVCLIDSPPRTPSLCVRVVKVKACQHKEFVKRAGGLADVEAPYWSGRVTGVPLDKAAASLGKSS